jgi:hypothetical protein
LNDTYFFSAPQLKRDPLDGNTALNTPVPVISRFTLGLGWLAWAALFPFGWAFLDVSVLRAGAPGPAHPWGWTWVSVLLLNLGYFVATTYTARFLGPFLVSFSEQGLRFVTLGGARQLNWSSIEDVQVRGPLVVLRGGSHTVLLNRFCYTTPSGLLPFLRRVLPPPLQSRVAV